MSSTERYSASNRTASSDPASRMRPPGIESTPRPTACATCAAVSPAAASASRSSSIHTSRSSPPITFTSATPFTDARRSWTRFTASQ